MKSTLVAILSLGLLGPAAAADVYKWVDADGNTHYSDMPQNEQAKLMTVRSQPTDPVRVAAERDAAREERAAREKATTEAADTTARTAQDLERREENCKRANDALESILNSSRLYEPLPDGTRRYLSESEVAERTERAFADVAEWCGDPKD